MNPIKWSIYIYTYIPSSFCRQVETEEPVNWVLVEINMFSAESDKGESEPWDSKLNFLLKVIGSVFGFANIWLLP